MPLPTARKLSGKTALLLGLLTFLLALPGRMALPPLDRDEPRYMEATEQMVLSGNLLDIRFQDTPRYLQPAGIYWLEALSARTAETVFGPPALRWSWVYRVPSLLAASLAVPLTAWIGATLFGAECGVLAGLFLLASTLFAAECRMATIDTVLLLDILCVEAALVRCYQHLLKNENVSLKEAGAYWLALGCGLMLKGPIVLIPGLATPLLLGASERDFRLWRSLRPSWGWLISLLIVAPWCVGIALVSHGAFFQTAVGHNLLGKITHAQETHGFPPGYYVLLFVLTFWPASWFTARALPQIWTHRRTASVRFLLCWALPVWLTFECLATKLPHYTLPAFPALALLTAASLTCWTPLKLSRWAQWALSLYGVLWLFVGLVLCSAGTILLVHFTHKLPAAEQLAFIGALIPLLAGSWLILRGQFLQGAYCALGCAILAQAGLFLVVIPRLDLIQLSPQAAVLFEKNRPCPNSALISVTDHEPSLVFLAGPQTRLVTPDGAAHSLQAHARCDLVLIDQRDEPPFRKALNTLGLKITEIGRVSGLNYSNGHKLDMGLFAAKAPIIPPAAQP